MAAFRKSFCRVAETKLPKRCHPHRAPFLQGAVEEWQRQLKNVAGGAKELTKKVQFIVACLPLGVTQQERNNKLHLLASPCSARTPMQFVCSHTLCLELSAVR